MVEDDIADKDMTRVRCDPYINFMWALMKFFVLYGGFRLPQ